MSRISYVNGQYCDHYNSSVHIEDRGFQFADGVYEVFGIIDGKIVDFEGHINRLCNSLIASGEFKSSDLIMRELLVFQ